MLTASRMPWQHTFSFLTLDFGESEEQLNPRRHTEIRPRQAAGTVAAGLGAVGTGDAIPAAAASSTVMGSTTSTSVAYPATPSATATDVNVTANIGKSFIDKAILPPDPSFGEISVDGPGL